MKRLWQRPMAREILLVLIVKLILMIIAIKLAFFSDSVRPDTEETARVLLSAPAYNTAPERSHPHD